MTGDHPENTFKVLFIPDDIEVDVSQRTTC